MDNQDFKKIIQRITGRIITNMFYLDYYYTKNIKPENDNPVEIVLNDGSHWLFHCDKDGESLLINEENWIDPFRNKLNKENIDYINKYGKWKKIPVSKGDKYSVLLENKIIMIIPIIKNNRIIGCVLRTGKWNFQIKVDFDEIQLELIK
jgi:hypothetical protein